jgi:hypothetical protein
MLALSFFKIVDSVAHGVEVLVDLSIACVKFLFKLSAPPFQFSYFVLEDKCVTIVFVKTGADF